MEDPVESRSPASASEQPSAEGSELKAAIAHFSRPEFRDEITRLYGAAKDRAIHERDRLAERAKLAATMSTPASE